MREIKFRAWDNVNKRMGYFRPGFSWQDEYDIWCLMDADDDRSKSITDVPCNDNINMMQFTGLKDKNGKEIYEGDIVKYEYKRDTRTWDIFNEVVEWVEMAEYSGFGVHKNMAHYEVIGNIFEHPHLLTKSPT